jgi:hypothetical protein
MWSVWARRWAVLNSRDGHRAPGPCVDLDAVLRMHAQLNEILRIYLVGGIWNDFASAATRLGIGGMVDAAVPPYVGGW